MLLQFLVGACVVIYFGNNDQILLFRRNSSGWFSLSVVLISYVVGVGCSSLLFLVLKRIVFCRFTIQVITGTVLIVKCQPMILNILTR